MKTPLLILFLLTIPALTFGHAVSFDQTIQQIARGQGVTEVADIDCQEVTDDQFEVLGDAVMGVMHPNEQDHELMDQMMGGEGSPSLKAAHILMGKKYLGCVSGMTGMMGMMEMMGGMGSGSGMGMGMGSGPMGISWGSGLASGNIWLVWSFQILFLAALVLAVIALAKWVFGKR